MIMERADIGRGQEGWILDLKLSRGVGIGGRKMNYLEERLRKGECSGWGVVDTKEGILWGVGATW